MNEEEILKYIKDEIEIDEDTMRFLKDIPESKTYKEVEKSIKAYKGLLDLYNKEKEKNKELEKQIEGRDKQIKILLGKTEKEYTNWE